MSCEMLAKLFKGEKNMKNMLQDINIKSTVIGCQSSGNLTS